MVLFSVSLTLASFPSLGAGVWPHSPSSLTELSLPCSSWTSSCFCCGTQHAACSVPPSNLGLLCAPGWLSLWGPLGRCQAHPPCSSASHPSGQVVARALWLLQPVSPAPRLGIQTLGVGAAAACISTRLSHGLEGRSRVRELRLGFVGSLLALGHASGRGGRLVVTAGPSWWSCQAHVTLASSPGPFYATSAFSVRWASCSP